MWDKHMAGGGTGLDTGRGDYDPARVSLLMIHGSGGDRNNYRAQLRGLRSVNPAAIDLPGHGATPGPSMTSVDDYAGWVAEFIAAGPIRPVVMGHSLGGAIALTLALQRPELIRGIIVVGSGSRLKVLPAILEGMRNAPQDTVKMVIGYAYGDDPRASLVAEGLKEMLQVPPEVVLGDFSACNDYDITDRLGEIKAPAKMIVGAQDRLTPPKYSQFLDEHLPASQGVEVIPGGGHMIYLENPQPFNRAVEKFVAGL